MVDSMSEYYLYIKLVPIQVKYEQRRLYDHCGTHVFLINPRLRLQIAVRIRDVHGHVRVRLLF